ncbi:hypothetical protein V6238_07435 [Marinomonas arenicola]
MILSSIGVVGRPISVDVLLSLKSAPFDDLTSELASMSVKPYGKPT